MGGGEYIYGCVGNTVALGQRKGWTSTCEGIQCDLYGLPDKCCSSQEPSLSREGFLSVTHLELRARPIGHSAACNTISSSSFPPAHFLPVDFIASPQHFFYLLNSFMHWKETPVLMVWLCDSNKCPCSELGMWLVRAPPFLLSGFEFFSFTLLIGHFRSMIGCFL